MKVTQFTRSDSFDLLPLQLMPEIRDYVMSGKRPGEFVSAVMSNDLMTALATIDPTERMTAAGKWITLSTIRVWLEEVGPPACYGSRQRMEAWISGCGWCGIDSKEKAA